MKRWALWCRRENAAGAAIAVLALFWCGSCQQPRHLDALTAGAAEGFNVLFITLDTTRADRIGCYGYSGATTPTIDALTQNGVRFADAVTVSPLTLPSHATIFTGLIPPHHEVRDNTEFRLEPKHVTLAEVMQQNGYDTSAFVSAFVLDARFGLDQGFDSYDDRLTTQAGFGSFNERPAAAVTTAAIDWLESRTSTHPFFCWIHYFDPHFPYSPPSPYSERFRDEPYDGEIAVVDDEIRRFLEALDRHGLTSNTLVVVVGDHGESLDEHAESSHGVFIYEAVMHVPLIFSGPGWIRGEHVVDEVVVSTIDILPTILDLIGVEDTHPRDGCSLARGRPEMDRALYMESLHPYFTSGWSPLYGLRRRRDKYILAPRPEYYDLQSDPRELNNLEGSTEVEKASNELANELAARLAGWADIEEVAAAGRELDSESIARLESLGYVAGVGRSERPGLADPKEMIPLMKEIARAENLVQTGQLSKALKVIEQVEAESPRHRRVLFNKATVQALLGHRVEAKETLRILNSIRASADSYLLLAQIFIQEGDHKEAAGLLDKAAALDPRHGGVFVARGDSLAVLGRFDEALAAYQQAQEVDPHRISQTAEIRIARLRSYVAGLPKQE